MHILRLSPNCNATACAITEALWSEGDNDDDLREAAAYCYKFMWGRGQLDAPHEWLDTALSKESVGVGLAKHAFPNLRMVFYEYVIERAPQSPTSPAAESSPRSLFLELIPKKARRRVCNPHWNYHLLDLAESVGVFQHLWFNSGLRNVLDQVELHKIRSRWSHIEFQQVFDVVALRLKGVDQKWPRAKRAAEFLGVQLLYEQARESYWQSDLLLASLRRLRFDPRDWEAADAKRRAKYVARLLYPFACHPVWEVTEAVASVLSSLREEPPGEAVATRVLDLWVRVKAYWQPIYAAVDAAYNSHGICDDWKRCKFVDLVNRHYNSQHSRVQFICAEDSFLWFAELVDDDGYLRDGKSLDQIDSWWKGLGGPVRWWLAHADDSALCYEVIQWARRAMMQFDEKNPGANSTAWDPIREAIQKLDRVTPLLSLGNPEWWREPSKEQSMGNDKSNARAGESTAPIDKPRPFSIDEWLKAYDMKKKKAVGKYSLTWRMEQPSSDALPQAFADAAD